jgi:hypothetical protein
LVNQIDAGGDEAPSPGLGNGSAMHRAVKAAID